MHIREGCCRSISSKCSLVMECFVIHFHAWPFWFNSSNPTAGFSLNQIRPMPFLFWCTELIQSWLLSYFQLYRLRRLFTPKIKKQRVAGWQRAKAGSRMSFLSDYVTHFYTFFGFCIIRRWQTATRGRQSIVSVSLWNMDQEPEASLSFGFGQYTKCWICLHLDGLPLKHSIQWERYSG